MRRELERLIDADTGAVLVTHLHGLACEMDRISAVCRERGVPLVEDAAQAFGARFGGRAVGSFGDVGIYSFGVYKNVNAFFGGMLVTPHADLAARLRAEIDAFPPQELGYFLTKAGSGLASDVATWPPLFKSLTYRIFRFGFLNDVALLNNQVTVDAHPEIKRELPESYLRRLTPMQARLILPQLEHVDEHIRARVRAAQRYHAGLQDLDEIVLPPLRTDFSHTYTYFPIQVKDRPDFLRFMMREHRDVAAQHLRNCADLPCFAEFQRECPNARVTAALGRPAAQLSALRRRRHRPQHRGGPALLRKAVANGSPAPEARPLLARADGGRGRGASGGLALVAGFGGFRRPRPAAQPGLVLVAGFRGRRRPRPADQPRRLGELVHRTRPIGASCGTPRGLLGCAAREQGPRPAPGMA